MINPSRVTIALRDGGFLAADEEARELIDASNGDSRVLSALLARRLTGEPLSWITGTTTFCGCVIQVHPGVYVPRWQSEPLARRAASHLPDGGVAIDLCTGSGAIAKVMKTAPPNSRTVASDTDLRAILCARANGVEAYHGDLFEPVPAELRGRCDVVVGVVPYVPTPNLIHLSRDTLAFETPLSYDGGPDGTRILRRVIEEAPRFLRRGGVLLLELGGDQPRSVEEDLRYHGFDQVEVLLDEEDDVRGIVARHSPSRRDQ